MEISWIPKKIKRVRVTAMDTLRAIAAFSVLIFHWGGIFEHKSEMFLIKSGHLGVDMFFVLSGFLVSLSFMYTKTTGIYFKKRLARILPLAYFSLGAIFLTKLYLHMAKLNWDNIIDFAVHLTFTQSLFKSHYYGQFPVMWTLSVELMFYILVPVLFYIGRKKLKTLLALMTALLIANFAYRYYIMGQFDTLGMHERIFYSEQIWGRFDQFIYGILLSVFFVFRDKFAKLVKYKYLLVFIGLAISAFAVYEFNTLSSAFREMVWSQVFLHSIFAFGFAIILMGLIFHSDKHGYKRIPVIDYLGEISYGVYVWHFFILTVLVRYGMNIYIGLALSTLATIVVSSTSWFVVEKPILTLVKKTGLKKTN